MKKLFAALAAATLVAAGCGSDSGSGDGSKVTLTWWDYFGYSPTADQAVTALINKYQSSHKNVEIKRTAIGFADFRTKLIQAAATGKFPDVAAIDNGDVPVFNAQGVLADLTSKMQGWQDKENFLDPVIASVKVGDKYFGVPFRSNTTALWYNKDAFAKAGISAPPKTWDELRATAKKLTVDRQAGFCFAAAPTEEGTFTLLPMIWQAGGDVPTIGDQASVDALSLVNALVNEDKSAPNSVLQWGQSDVGDQFGSGLCAMMANGPWVLASVKKGGFAFDVAPWPAGAKGTASPLGGEVLAISKGSAHQDAAFELATWLADPKNSRDEVGAGLGSIPNRKDTVDDPGWSWHPMVPAFAKQLQAARARGVYGPKYAQISQAISTMEQQVLAQGRKPAEAAGEARSKIEPLLAG
jgi:multiple sugar transport system substrate-binding protein